MLVLVSVRDRCGDALGCLLASLIQRWTFVASFNAQSVTGNDMVGKRCEISTFIKDNGIDLFL